MTDNRCWLRLTNGWTVSISEDDTPPAICCLAAWPTRQDNLVATNMIRRYDEIQLFDFGGGDNYTRTDCRCWTFLDVREALQKIANASPPASDEAVA